MIDHVSIPVRDLAASAAFYEQVLAPLGYRRLVERPHTIAFGKRYPELWINHRPNLRPTAEPTGNHVCLRARSEEEVRAFHRTALELGGRSDGDPGPRRAEMTGYFGAYILDPDGNKIEAASFPPAPEPAAA